MIKIILFYVWKFTFVTIFSVFYILQFLVYSFLTRNKPVEKIDLSSEPSCLKDPSLGSHGSLRLKKRDIEVHYVAKGDRSKPLMLFVHGFPEFWYIWKYQLKEFGNDYYAVAMDMTGYGGTSKPTDVKRYDREDLAMDIKEFILELGFESAILVSHDWGGVLSYIVAASYPEVVEKLVVMNAPNKYAFNKGFSFKQLLKSSYMFYFQLPIIPEYFLMSHDCGILDMLHDGPAAIKNKDTFTKEDVTAYKYTFLRGGFTCPLNYYRNSMNPPMGKDDKTKMKTKKKNITVPTLIIWGTKDEAMGVELAKYSAEIIDNCQVKYVEGAGHFVNVERPEEVNQHIRDYLANS